MGPTRANPESDAPWLAAVQDGLVRVAIVLAKHVDKLLAHLK